MSKKSIAAILIAPTFLLFLIIGSLVRYESGRSTEIVEWGDQEFELTIVNYRTIFRDPVYSKSYLDDQMYSQGPVTYTGKRHGRWIVAGEYVFYWYGEEMSEAVYMVMKDGI